MFTLLSCTSYTFFLSLKSCKLSVLVFQFFVYKSHTQFFLQRVLLIKQIGSLWYCNTADQMTTKDVLFMTKSLDQYQSVEFRKLILLKNSQKIGFLLGFKLTFLQSQVRTIKFVFLSFFFHTFLSGKSSEFHDRGSKIIWLSQLN